jgi:hypothetical protein
MKSRSEIWTKTGKDLTVCRRCRLRCKTKGDKIVTSCEGLIGLSVIEADQMLWAAVVELPIRCLVLLLILVVVFVVCGNTVESGIAAA